MAFITVEDMIGNVEVLIFPKDCERYKLLLSEDEKVLVTGRVSIGDDPEGKLVLEKLVPFEQVPKEVWLQFEDKADFDRREQEVLKALSSYDGNDTLVVYLKSSKQYRKYPASRNILACSEAVDAAKAVLGDENVKVRVMALR